MEPAPQPTDQSAPPITQKSNALLTAAMCLLAVGGLAGAIHVALNRSSSAAPPAQSSADAPPSAVSTPVILPSDRPEFAHWKPPVSTDRQAERDAMVDVIASTYNINDTPVLNALAAIPRHEYVPADIAPKAYDDSPEPIPNGQLISQPWIVATMTSQLHLKPDDRVLEIGTGSGYQATVLSYFTKNVFTIEIIKPLGEAAAARLKRLGYDPIQTRIADGFNGWPEAGPFDAIIVTCAAGSIPPPLIMQLKPGGRMVIPVGNPFAQQSLMLVEKDTDGGIHSQSLTFVKFVPLLQKDPTANGN